jgi:hypothetical protein
MGEIYKVSENFNSFKKFSNPPPPPKKWKSNFFPSYAYCMLSSVSTEKVFTYSSLGNYFSVPENSVTILETS